MRRIKINLVRRFKITAFFGLFLFLAIHLFYDPYRVVETIAASKEKRELRVGDPEERLVVLPDVKSGTQFRVATRVAWNSVEAGAPAWKMARVIFACYDKSGRWIPAPHGVCAVTGSGRGSFHSLFIIPEGAASARLVFQHLGRSGQFLMSRFALERVEVKRVTPALFRGLQVFWVCLACWAAWVLRLLRRRGGWAVVFVAALIAGGMLLPGKVIDDAPCQVAGLVRPPADPVQPEASTVSREESDIIAPSPAGRASTAIRKGRHWIAERVLSFDFHMWAHASLFLLLGAVCRLCFLKENPQGRQILRVFTYGLLYALATELLQVTELTRSVRVSDIGVNVLGWLAGLLAVALFARGHRPRSACREQRCR